ncbi:MAG: hypothetical protein ABJJ44_20330 [Paraglaciecola sp.]|uniref:hypothetical protein n=1 Tax=Paraglaciecola sp. TaxID=1920173 RepID=UPI0032982EA0
MKVESFMNIISNLGKGILMGVGMGASLFGVLLMAISFNQNQSENIGGLVAILVGVSCLLMALKVKGKPHSN